MKIAFIYTHLGEGGGTYQLLRLIHELKKRHEIMLFTEKDTTPDRYKDFKKDIKIIEIPQIQWLNKKNKFFFLFDDIFSSVSLAAQIKKYEFDIVSPHEHPAHLAAVILKFIKGKKIVRMCNDVWHIPHFEQIDEKRRLFKLYKYTLGWWINYLLTRKIDKIIVLDHRIQNIIHTSYRKEAVIIRSGIDLGSFMHLPHKQVIRKKNGIKNIFTILCFSIFFPHRRFEDVIKAVHMLVKKNISIQLYIIGSSHLSPSYFHFIKNLIKNLHLEKYVFVIDKFISLEKQKEYYSASDVFVFPNERQTWGLAAVEAMASGKPVIVSDGAGIHEVINRKMGYVYSVGDVPRLITCILSLLENQKKRESMGKTAREYVFKHLSWEKYTNKMQEVFQNI